MGACFLSLLETQSQLLTSAAEIMSPLGSYKEVGTSLIDNHNNSSLKEAILNWLAASQVSVGGCIVLGWLVKVLGLLYHFISTL